MKRLAMLILAGILLTSISCNLPGKAATPLPIYVITTTSTHTPTPTLTNTGNATSTPSAGSVDLPTQPVLTDTPSGNDINGIWITETGQEVKITKNPLSGEAIAVFISSSDGDCPNGGHRNNYLDGELNGKVWTGTMYRCTKLKEMVDDCGLTSIFTRDFTATVTADRIDGTYLSEYYDYDANAKGNCKWVRNSGGDQLTSFSLTRKN
jgi:hypothetical protein